MRKRRSKLPVTQGEPTINRQFPPREMPGGRPQNNELTLTIMPSPAGELPIRQPTGEAQEVGRPPPLQPQSGCELWRGTFSGNDRRCSSRPASVSTIKTELAGKSSGRACGAVTTFARSSAGATRLDAFYCATSGSASPTRDPDGGSALSTNMCSTPKGVITWLAATIQSLVVTTLELTSGYLLKVVGSFLAPRAVDSNRRPRSPSWPRWLALDAGLFPEKADN